jgi:hypothetical protein
MPTTSPKSTPKKDTRLDVLAGVKDATNSYVKTERTLYSKYWPILDQVIEMATDGILAKEIARQFKEAYQQATKNGKQLDNNLQGFQLVISRAITVARMDPERLLELRRNGSGFHHVYKLAREELHESHPRPPGTAAASEKQGKSFYQQEADQGVENAQTYADATTMPSHMQPDKSWRAKNRYILQNDPESFIAMLEELVSGGLLPDTIMPEIVSYIKGE